MKMTPKQMKMTKRPILLLQCASRQNCEQGNYKH